MPRLRGSRAAAALGLVLGCAPAPEAPGREREQPPLVVLVSMDTVRADRTSLNGYERPTTPHLDALAAEGTRFAHAGAQATQTLLSHKSLFTSKYPLRLLREASGHDLAELAELRHPWKFLVARFANLASPSLVERLRAAGYRTEAYTDGGWMRSEMNFHEGFDHYDEEGGGFEQIVPRAIGALESLARAHEPQPLFLFVHAYDAHCPYPTREPMNSRFCAAHPDHLDLEDKCAKPELLALDLSPADLRAIGDHYDGGLQSADAWVGDLLAALRRLELFDEALIVVTSDHGESLGERGEIGHGGHFLEQLLVPLVVKWPASWRVPAGVVEDPVALLDVLPTVLEACGVEAPADLDGRSLLGVARGEVPGRAYLVSQIGFREGLDKVTRLTKRAAWVPGASLVIHDAGDGALQVYDLRTDPGGLREVADERPAFMPGQLATLARHDGGERAGASTGPDELVLDEEMRRQLEALGYATD